MSGKRNELEINPDFELFNYMEYREDIWKRETRENVNFTRELSELNGIKIVVKNAVNLYDELGGDKNLLGEEVKNEIKNE